MKIVSTKLDNANFDRLMEMCNDDGECISESLRGMIKQHLEAHEEWKESKKLESKSNSSLNPIAKAKIISTDQVPVYELKNPKVVEM